MSSEFEDFEKELDSLEQHFDSFESDFDELHPEMPIEFPALQRIEFTEVIVRTALLAKNNMFALLCLKTADQGGAICRVDPREENPAVQVYDDPEKAEEWYLKSLGTSKKNGWSVVYDGLPLQG